MIKGKTIAITRSKDDSEEFIDLITRENGNVLPLPTIELVSKGEKIVEEFLSALENEDPDFSVFMSSKAVSLLFDTAKKLDKFEKLQLAVANTTVIAVGPKTKAILEKENVKVAYMPQRYSSVGIGGDYKTKCGWKEGYCSTQWSIHSIFERTFRKNWVVCN